jgi:hypothetical protein
MTREGAEACRTRWERLLPYRWAVAPHGDGYGLKADGELTKDEWTVLYEDWKRNPAGLPVVPARVWDIPGRKAETR